MWGTSHSTAANKPWKTEAKYQGRWAAPLGTYKTDRNYQCDPKRAKHLMVSTLPGLLMTLAEAGSRFQSSGDELLDGLQRRDFTVAP